MPFQPEYSESFKAELLRLDRGNTTEKKRAQTARTKIAAVCQAPFSPTYTKDLPQQYGAIAVTGRFRLFFKVHQEHEVVFFAWMNDEENIHASGATNDAYQEFRRKLANGEIETYRHVGIESDSFVFSGTWGNAYIYVEFTRDLTDKSTQRAGSSLTLSQVGRTDYAISSIEVSDENEGLASELLGRTLTRADEGGITVTYDLFLISTNLGKSRHLLQKFDFERADADDELELWIRRPHQRSPSY